MASHHLLLLHASRASVDPVSAFYLREAADLRPVNILDEGVMGDLHEKNWGRAVARLRDLIRQAADAYGVETVLERAARSFEGPIGLAATFPSNVDTSLAWLRHFRPDAEIEVVCDAEALQALLRGERDEHNHRLPASATEMAVRGVGGIVPAQVSMARLADKIRRLTGLVVLESLATSLAGVCR